MTAEQHYHPIRVVERDTGIGRDTLRVWERRYGFPEPIRNERGERVYAEAQIRHLQRIRRLLDQGLRPGKLLSLDEAGLTELEASIMNSQAACDEDTHALLATIRNAEQSRLESLLSERYAREGMRGFLLQTVSPLLRKVGEAWAAGELQIYQEHFFTGVLTRFILARLGKLPENPNASKVLLGTLPGEQHTLGLLMVHSLLMANGKQVINLGAEVPMNELVLAATQFSVAAVGLTFSGAYAYKLIRPHVQELRGLLAPDIEIWIGGEAVHRLRKLPTGVRRFDSLQHLADL